MRSIRDANTIEKRMRAMAQYGMAKILPPPKRQDDDAAFNQLIDKMDLEEVKRFMCPKSNQNPLKCMNCEGFKKCTAGQRAVRLTDEMTRATEQKTQPVNAQKWEEKPSNNPTAIERDEFIRACESGNAWHWLMQTRGISKDAAGELLSRLIKKFPGVAADYGGGRRIMQRPKVVRIEPVEARVEQEQASEPKEEQTEAIAEKEPEQAENKPGMSDYNRQMMEAARERCRQAMSSGDPVKWLVDDGTSEGQARRRVREWIEKYPDLCEGFELESKKRGRKPKMADSVEKVEVAEDEVSLEDFLEEYQVPAGGGFQTVMVMKSGAADMLQDAQERPETGDPMLDGMNAKLKELEAEKGRLIAQIEVIEARQEAIRKCLAAFKEG